MVVTLGQQYNTGEKRTVVMLLVVGKEKIFTLYNESTEIFYDVYSETVVSKTKYSTQFTQLVGVSGTSWKNYFTLSPSQLYRVPGTVVQYSTLWQKNKTKQHVCPT